MKRLVYVIPLLVLIGFGALFVMGLNRDPNNMPTALAGKELPAIPEGTLEGYDGGNVDEIIANNKVVLVNFWASWCPPCRAEHPNLEKLQEMGIPIIGINHQDQPQNAIKFLKEQGNPFTAVRADESGRTGIDWGVAGLPETFFVKNGKVVDRHTGPIVGDRYDEFLAKYNELMED